MILFNPLDYPTCFNKPRRLTDITSWHEHIPFAFVIVQMLNPKVFVELGTHKGDSYCAFCQAVDTLGLNTSCFAIDTWEGDEQAGFYSSDILKELQAYHDPIYGKFSQLVKSSFDQARDNFSDGIIDLLHIDGLHTYEAVKHDFENWLPKMSKSGVILLHDTNVHKNDFGVWRLSEELKEKYNIFRFNYCNGLDVITVGTEIPEEFLKLLNVQEQDRTVISNFFFHIGNKITLLNKLQAKDIQISELTKLLQSRDAAIVGYENLLQSKNAYINELTNSLETVYQSITWQMVMKFQTFIEKALPLGTRRRRWYDSKILMLRRTFRKKEI